VSGRILVVAGHDSSGRAGVDADREAAEDFGWEIAAVVTAWTRQDESGVRALDPRDPAEWSREARELLGSGVAALKVGLLPGASHVRALAGLLDAARRSRVPCVVDPVLRASSGEEFLDGEGVRALHEEVLTRDVVLTPNVPEAAQLAGRDPERLARDLEARVAAGEELLDRGLAALLLKGGHGGEDPVQDLVLARGRKPIRLEHPRVPGGGLRGSGCRYATAAAVGLAGGGEVRAAAEAAGAYLFSLLER